MEPTSHDIERGHAPYAERARPIVLSAVALVAVMGAALAVVAGVFRAFEASDARTDRAPHGLRAERELPPAPRLQADPAGELEEHDRTIDARLAGYDWIDREGGIVRVPVERALDLVLERGLPRFEPGGEEVSR